MTAVYEWVRNITYYMIFITVVGNLLADSKYEKYLRFFAGMILILLVLKPLTGSLRLDERIAYLFESISFQKEADDFKDKLWGMEDERLERVMGTYEEAVAMDLRGMADTAGFAVRDVKVTIETDRNNPLYGHVTDLYMKLARQKEENVSGAPWVPLGGGGAGGNASGGNTSGGDSGSGSQGPIDIQIEPVRIGEAEGDNGSAGNAGSAAAGGGGGVAGTTAGGSSGAAGNAAGGTGGVAGNAAGGTGGVAGNSPSAPPAPDSASSAPLSDEEAAAVAVEQGQILARTFPANLEERTKINSFIRKVAGYYGLETAHVQVEWEDD